MTSFFEPWLKCLTVYRLYQFFLSFLVFDRYADLLFKSQFDHFFN